MTNQPEGAGRPLPRPPASGTGTSAVSVRVATRQSLRSRIAESKWIAPAVIGVLIVGSLLVRLINLHSPLLEVHHFRQTQTAFTVWYYVHDGIDLFHPMMPVLGPPWVVAMEFPIFQAAAALLIRATGMDIDAGCRLTNIIFFYASAGVLYLLARSWFQRHSTAICVLMFYLWSPYSIVWSRTSMIEFAAATFGLAYVYFMVRWLQSRRNLLLPFMALVFGSLGALTKITSMAAVVPLMISLPAAVIWNDMRRSDPSLNCRHVKALCRALLRQWRTIALLLMLYLVPVALGQAWVSYGDRMKAATPSTRFLTSENLSTWNYGTVEQRLTPDWWRQIAVRIAAYVTPYGLMALPVIALVAARNAPPLTRLVLCSAFIGAILPILIFFNLYHEHDYYLCAVFPLIAILAGYGLDHVMCSWVLVDWRAAVPIIAAAAMSWFVAYDYIAPGFAIDYNNPICQLGRAIDEVAAPDDEVVVADWDWAPSILYYAKRRGYMVREDSAKDSQPDVRSIGFLRSAQFTTLVCQRQHPWFTMWPGLTALRQVGPFAILRIKHS